MIYRSITAIVAVFAFFLGACSQPVPSTAPGTVVTGGGGSNTTPPPQVVTPVTETVPQNSATPIAVRQSTQADADGCYRLDLAKDSGDDVCGVFLTPASIGKVQEGQTVSVQLGYYRRGGGESLFRDGVNVIWSTSGQMTGLFDIAQLSEVSNSRVVWKVPSPGQNKLFKVLARGKNPYTGRDFNVTLQFELKQ